MPHNFCTIPKWFVVLILSFSFYHSFAQKYDAEVINTETTIEVKGSKMVKKHFYAIRVNNRNGDSYAEISIPFNKINAISDLQAYITDNNGIKVKSLKKDDITVRSANSESSFYTDTYVKEFSLRNNTYPYTLIYSYQEEASQFFSLEHWWPVIDDKVPTLQARLTVITPKDFKINYHGSNIDKPKIDSLGDVIFYQWKASYTEIILPETWSPSVWQFIPNVNVVPDHFRYDTEGTQDSWKSFGNWNLSLLSGMDDLPLTELFIIHNLTDSISDTTEKIRTLYHYLQKNTRYINVMIKTGGMKPYPASYVAENKYGDCKALSNYFKACLASVGIKSYYTLIIAGAGAEPLDTAFPSQQFNHVIVFVPLQRDTLWLDCTSDLAFGYLGTPTQNRPALVMMNNASKLITTPALSCNDVMRKRNITAKVNYSNALECEFSGTYRGYRYENFSGIGSQLSETERKTYLSRYLVETGFQLDKYTSSSRDRDIPEINLEYSASSDQYLKSYGNESLLKVIPIELTLIENPKKRKLPVQINYPVYQVDTVNYVLPANFAITALPGNIKLDSDYGEYHVSFSQQGQTAQVIKQLKIKACTISPADYPAFYTFYNGILESEKSLYITLSHQ